MPCEMCGKEAPLKTTIVEGSKMRLCPDCQKYGKTVEQPRSSSGGAGGSGSGGASSPAGRPKPKPKPKPRDVYESHPEVLVEDYGVRIRNARNKAGLTVEELSDEINEKRSVISRTEGNDHHPSDELVKKLERKLSISLMEKPESTQFAGGSSTGKKGSKGPVTLGDLLKEQMDEE